MDQKGISNKNWNMYNRGWNTNFSLYAYRFNKIYGTEYFSAPSKELVEELT